MRFLFLSLILLLASFSSMAPAIEVPAPAEIHRIWCGEFASEAEADLGESRLSTQGVGPITRIEEDGRIHLFVGEFETNSEAWAYSRMMKDFGVLDTVVRSFPNDEQRQFTTTFTASTPPLLIPREQKFEPLSTPRESLMADQRMATLQYALAQQERELVIASGLYLVEALDDNDPVKARAMVEVGRALVQRDKQSAPALPYLLKVARGEVQASMEDLLEARFMVADSWHYYWFAPLKGFRAYKEILEEHGDIPEVRARCLVEMTACLLELARMPLAEWKASFDDVRRMARRLQSEVPPEFVRAHAVADLIYCESYLFEAHDPKYAGEENHEKRIQLFTRAYEAFQGFETRHPGRTREISMANDMRGHLQYELRNWPAAIEYYERNIRMDFSDPNENFYWIGEMWNMKERAAEHLVMYAGVFGDQETRSRYQAYLDDEMYRQGVVAELGGFDFAFPHSFYERREGLE